MRRLFAASIERAWWVKLHRWAGLYMALFLIVAGLTGSILAFTNEIDGWLNPASKRVAVTGAPMDPVALLARAKALAPPTVEVWNSLSLAYTPDQPVGFLADARIDPSTGRPFENVPRELRLDPYTGALVGIRYGEPPLWPVTRENLLGIVFRLHYSLALPGGWGTWLFGIAAIVWTIDCFVGVYLTFPIRIRRRPDAPTAASPRPWLKRWAPAWLVRWFGGGYKLNFDLHRAGGLWLWVLLLLFAWSSVRLNLMDQVYNPVMATFFDMSVAGPPTTPRAHPSAPPRLAWHAALAHARRLAAEQGAREGFEPLGEIDLGYDPATGQYAYRFESTADINDGTYLTFDGDTGAMTSLLLSDRKHFGPWISEWISAIHMAQVGGLAVQVLVCLTGIVTVMLSVTGLVIWWRKRRARRQGGASGMRWMRSRREVGPASPSHR